MDSLTYNFSLLSDTFAHGAYQTQNFNRPELRAPSVKGMIRWWHKALGYSEQDAGVLFGQAIGETKASRVSVRVSPLAPVQTEKADFMPHKGYQGGTKTAIRPGSMFALVLTQRRETLSAPLWEQLHRSSEAWLLLGAVGQRSNRAAGSIHWDHAPPSRKEFEIKASEVIGSAKIRFAVLGADLGGKQQRARHLAGDFLKDDAFGGSAPFGSAYPRKPSPLKLKCVELDDTLRLLAIWDYRAESAQSLERGIQTLIRSNKEIGRLLEEAFPRLTAQSPRS